MEKKKAEKQTTDREASLNRLASKVYRTMTQSPLTYDEFLLVQRKCRNLAKGDAVIGVKA